MVQPLYIFVCIMSLGSIVCFCKYFLCFLIVGSSVSNSIITSFRASVSCSVDWAGINLFVSGVSPLASGGGGTCLRGTGGLIVTNEAGTLVTGSGCVLVVGCGWVFCVTVSMGEHKRDKICLAVFSSNFGCCKSSLKKSFAIGLNPLTCDLTLYIHHTINPKLVRIKGTISIISTH